MLQKSAKLELLKIIEIAIAEDRAFEDITSDLTVAKNLVMSFEINPREEIIFCGKDVISMVFSQLKKSAKFKNSALDLKILVKDGELVKPGKSIARGVGEARLIFAAERVILNFIQHLSGVSSLTQKFVEKLGNKKIQILDTRKTLPGLRTLEKYAVLAGGGGNHRLNLSDMILIKDNHLAIAGGIEAAINAAKKFQKKSLKKIKIEVECDTVEQVMEAIKTQPDIIMLDNMKIPEIKKSVALIRQNPGKKIAVEISGGVNLKNIQKLSRLEPDFISIGSLTHSARAVDIGLDVVIH